MDGQAIFLNLREESGKVVLCCLMFIISAEIMAENVRKTKEFRGLTVWGEEIKLSEYAYPRWL